MQTSLNKCLLCVSARKFASSAAVVGDESELDRWYLGSEMRLWEIGRKSFLDSAPGALVYSRKLSVKLSLSRCWLPGGSQRITIRCNAHSRQIFPLRVKLLTSFLCWWCELAALSTRSQQSHASSATVSRVQLFESFSCLVLTFERAVNAAYKHSEALKIKVSQKYVALSRFRTAPRFATSTYILIYEWLMLWP